MDFTLVLLGSSTPLTFADMVDVGTDYEKVCRRLLTRPQPTEDVAPPAFFSNHLEVSFK